MELLSPVGSYESLQSAIKSGADAVYFGITYLNMRAGSSAKKFDFEDLQKIAEICHEKNVRTYITLNTIMYDNDMSIMQKIIDNAKKAGIDAVIVSDMAALLYANKVKMEAHCSTQLSISNYETVKFFAQYSDRLVLARELTLEQIKLICDNIKKDDLKGPRGRLLEIEIFGHGAMCVSVSGRCFLSGLQHNLSANRGLCRQTCRRGYKIIDEETGDELKVRDKYILSPKDLCSMEFLDKVVLTGANVLKIEGRGRSSEYVYTVTTAYRRALDSIEQKNYSKEVVEEGFEELKSVYNRGLSSGFYFGQPIDSWSKAYGSKATTRKLFCGKVLHYYPKIKIAEILIQASETIKKGDWIYVIGSTSGVVKLQINEFRDADRNVIEEAGKGSVITFRVEERVRENDQVYIIEKLEGGDEDRLKDRIQG